MIAVEFIKHKEELPNFIELLHEVEGDTLLGGGEDGDVVALKLTSEKCCLVSTQNFRLGRFNDYIMVKKRMENSGFTEITEVSAPDDVVDLLITNHAALIKSTSDGFSDAEQEFFNLVGQAVNSKASDIHMERWENNCIIRFRIDGDLITHTEWITTKADEVIQVAYTVLGQNKEQTWDRKRPQDTDIKLMIQGKPVKLRYSHSPMAETDSWHAVFRVIVQDENGARTLEEAGYSEEQIKAIKKAMRRPVGLILLVGETNSGKSSTITSLLTMLNEAEGGRISIQTVEDPPEYKVKDVIQTPVIRIRDKNDAQDVNFVAKSIRSNLRRDPDVINLGEIRDEETAKGSISASQSGHKVFSTLHAANPIVAIERLEDLGIPRNVMASSTFFSCIIFQTLLPVLAKEEKKEIEFSADDPKFDADFESMVQNTSRLKGKTLYTRGSSLKHPNGTDGRTVGASVMFFDNEMRRMIKEGDYIGLEEYWLKKGRETNYEFGVGYRALDHALDKVADGQICPYDVMKKLGELDVQ